MSKTFIVSILTGCALLVPTMALAASVPAQVKGGVNCDQSAAGVNVKLINATTGQTLTTKPTDSSGWVIFVQPLTLYHTYKVDPQISSCPEHTLFVANGAQNYPAVKFCVTVPKFGCQ